ncbi:unnamed protein product [Orchesella dallaii]|uniref:Uncharacterized protein n=1 Tax=Orchesella dallaii TaxID=48710 RepID=A0ABP1PMT0_9HEXA
MSNVRAKISPSKVAKKLSSLANTKGAKGLTKATGSLSKYFQAKSIVNRMHGDKASLTMLGARIGGEVALKVAIKLGMKVFSSASKVGKAFTALGKIAGPLGTAADIGLSVYSLMKSVERYHSAGNVFDKRSVVADIISDSVDIGVTAPVTVASFDFPPAAPFFIAVGVVIDVLNKLVTSMFKAANEVDRINAEIPLLVSEKRMVFTSRFFDWFGKFLVEEKKQMTGQLATVSDFAKKILHFEESSSPLGPCPMTEVVVRSGCDRDKPCGGYSSCSDYWERKGAWAYVDFKCVCDSNSKTEFGYPRSDQTVDFRKMNSLYWERAVPNDVEGAEFKCKPGSLTFQDYKVHQENSRIEYLRKNAIAMVQPWSRRRKGQIMLFDLEDGKDVVYINKEDATPNLFRVRNGGVKSFHGELRSRDGKIEMSLKSIQQVNGRKDEGETEADCFITKVALQGGNYERPDLIKLKKHTFENLGEISDHTTTNCCSNVTIIVEDYTTIESEGTWGTISIYLGNSWVSRQTQLYIASREYLKLSMIFLTT